MRLWIFDFDVMISAVATDRAATRLDPACDAMLRRLASFPADQVAIVSSRKVYDIAECINIPGVIFGGCCGMEWELPSGYRVGPFRECEDDLIRCRLNILPELSQIVSGHGIEMGDKLWSIAVDTSQMKYNARIKVEKKICAWSIKHGLAVSSGRNQIDIQLIPGFNKSVGISYLARMFDIVPAVDSIVYAGSDESDAVALWWTMLFGGTAIMVNRELSVKEAHYAKDTSALIAMIDNMADMPC
jgi:trehalose-phosphatase